MQDTSVLIDAFSPNFEVGIQKLLIGAGTKTFKNNVLLLGVHKEDLLDNNFLTEIAFKMKQAQKYNFTNKTTKIALMEKPQSFSKTEWERIEEIEKKLKKQNIDFGFYDEKAIFDVKLAKSVINKIEAIANKVKQQNLTPFEKVMLAYSIAQRRFYKVEKFTEGKDRSRAIYSVLTNEEIVCVGFSRIFETLIEFFKDDNIKVIPNTIVTTVTETNVFSAFHRNNIVYLKDKSYNINGVYYCDSTWDCKQKEDENMLRLRYFMLPIKDIDKIKKRNIVDRILKNYISIKEDDKKRSFGSNAHSKREDKLFLKNISNKHHLAYLPNIRDFYLYDSVNSVSKDGIRILDVDFVNKLLEDEVFSNIIESFKEQKNGKLNNIDLSLVKIKDKVNNLEILEEIFNAYNITTLGEKDYSILKRDLFTGGYSLFYDDVKQIIERHLQPDFKFEEKERTYTVPTILDKIINRYTFFNNKAINLPITNLINLEKGLNEIGLDYSSFQKAVEYFSTPISLTQMKGAIRNLYKKTTALSSDIIENDLKNIIEFNKSTAKKLFKKDAQNCLYQANFVLDYENNK